MRLSGLIWSFVGRLACRRRGITSDIIRGVCKSDALHQAFCGYEISPTRIGSRTNGRLARKNRRWRVNAVELCNTRFTQEAFAKMSWPAKKMLLGNLALASAASRRTS